MPSMNDIAKLAGVSKATVSLALAGHPRISEETKAKIQAIAQQIGYLQTSERRSGDHSVPPVNARHLWTPQAANSGHSTSARGEPADFGRKTGASIGVLYVGDNQSFTHGFFRDTLMGICDEAARNQTHVVMIGIRPADENADSELVYSKVIEAGVAGVIVVSSTPKLYGFDGLAQLDFPMVFVGNRRLADRDNALHCVSSDNYEGGVIATEHLLRLGHRKLAVVVSEQPLLWETDRLNGFFSALRAAGIAAGKEVVIRTDNVYDSGEDVWNRLRQTGATAVFATNPLLGGMMLRQSRANGVNLPEQLSLLVFDDMEFFPLENPPVTVIKQDLEMLGILSAQMLLDLIGNPGQPARQVLLPTSLTVRGSTAPPAVEV